jgi:uncharacterized membrane protein
MPRVAVAWALVLGIWTWMAALVLAPLTITDGRSSRSAVAAGLLVYMVGGTVCHQHPVRSVHLRGAPMPVCARCTGLYGGAAIGIAAAVLTAHRRRWCPLRRVGLESLDTWRIALVAAAMPTAVTFTLEKVGGIPITNGARLAAGVILGATVGWVVASSLRGRETTTAEQPEVNYRHARSDGDAGATE